MNGKLKRGVERARHLVLMSGICAVMAMTLVSAIIPASSFTTFVGVSVGVFGAAVGLWAAPRD